MNKKNIVISWEKSSRAVSLDIISPCEFVDVSPQKECNIHDTWRMPNHPNIHQTLFSNNHLIYAVSGDNHNYSIISVAANSNNNFSGYDAIIVDKNGQTEERIYIDNSLIEKLSNVLDCGKNDELHGIKYELKRRYNSVISINNPLISDVIPTIEYIYDSMINPMVIGLIYHKGDQTRSEAFNNDNSKEFSKFCRLLGHKQSLKYWEGDRANMSVKDKTIVSVFRGKVQVIYHVGIKSWLTDDQYRQFIGNDTLLIIYSEGEEYIRGNIISDVSFISDMGKVPQYIAIVTRINKLYKIRFLVREGNNFDHIEIPCKPVSPKVAREILLINMYNSAKSINISPSFCKIYTDLRQDYINGIVNKIIKYNEHDYEKQNNRQLYSPMRRKKSVPLDRLPRAISPSKSEPISHKNRQMKLSRARGSSIN